MDRLLGLETEYGLYIEGVDIGDLTSEARALVSFLPAGPRWDYRDESPLQDLRGFRAPRLRTNPKDDRYERISHAPRPRTAHEEHVDRVLPNGARLYHDHGHPEYSTPECHSLKDLIAQDRAGERIVWACAKRYEQRTGRAVSVYKNNTDYHGMSYGCHENYLVPRVIPLEQLVNGILPFLVTRILYAGAGKVGTDPQAAGERVIYQLSQRADFFDEILGIDTLHHRPLINTRDEPHADRHKWRRLHVICGDANLSEYATALKMGTTALVLATLEAGYGPPVELKDPVRAIKQISHDQDRHWLVEQISGRTIPAIDIQRAYLRAAQELFAGRDEETDWVLREWESVLDDLEADPRRLKDRLDWVAKRELLESFIESEGAPVKGDLDLLCSLELEYHNLDPERGLSRALERAGALRRWTHEAEIEEAMRRAPQDTRAFLRGLCVQRFEVRSASWSRVMVTHRNRTVELDLKNLVGGTLEVPYDATLEDLIQWVADSERRLRR